MSQFEQVKIPSKPSYRWVVPLEGERVGSPEGVELEDTTRARDVGTSHVTSRETSQHGEDSQRIVKSLAGSEADGVSASVERTMVCAPSRRVSIIPSRSAKRFNQGADDQPHSTSNSIQTNVRSRPESVIEAKVPHRKAATVTVSHERSSKPKSDFRHDPIRRPLTPKRASGHKGCERPANRETDRVTNTSSSATSTEWSQSAHESSGGRRSARLGDTSAVPQARGERHRNLFGWLGGESGESEDDQ